MSQAVYYNQNMQTFYLTHRESDDEVLQTVINKFHLGTAFS